MVDIVVLCPGGVTTGGPEALHQLVDASNRVKENSAAILYIPHDIKYETPSSYSGYKTPQIKFEDIPKSSLIVIPEIWPYFVNEFNQDCALWWLSVDSFVCNDNDVVDKYKYHLAQSAYAYNHIHLIRKKTPIQITDYINSTIYQSEFQQKEKSIVVNPAKGLELIESFEKQNPDLKIIRIQGMSNSEVTKTFLSSSLYIDFGHHPGRDRMPREAALANCVVMTTNIGAAAFHEDVPIGDFYKFSAIDEASVRARQILSETDKHLSAQSEYREIITNQKSVFHTEVSTLLNLIGAL